VTLVRLGDFIDRFSPEVAELARQTFDAMRKRLPGAVVMVYDKADMLVIGFGPTERPSEAILSIIVSARRVTVCFLHGVSLPDPKRLMHGSGKRVRNLRLTSARDLETPAVRAIMRAAIAAAPKPFAPAGVGPIVIRQETTKPRRR
jgi:hypothetical protein